MPYYEEEIGPDGKKRLIPKATDAEKRLSWLIFGMLLMGNVVYWTLAWLTVH